MNAIELLHRFREAVESDADLDAWANATYGRPVSVFVGIDEKNPPGDGDYPLLHLFPRARREGYDAGESQETVIGVSCGVLDDGVVSLPAANTTEAASVSRLDELRRLALAAIDRADIGGAMLAEVETEYETVEFWPYLVCVMLITVREEYLAGQDPFA